MANSDSIDPTKPPLRLEPEDLQLEVDKRKAWFFECQLRRLTLESFRDVEVNEQYPDALLNTISEGLLTVGFPAGQVGSRMKRLTQTYLDSKQPVWTREERDHRNEFAGTFISNTANWLNYGAPVKLIKNLAKLKELYEKNKTSSTIDDEGELSSLGREDPGINKEFPNDRNRLSHAISRVAITERAPWLIPEVFNGRNVDTSDVEKWIKNGETFVSNYEIELNEVLGGGRIPKEPFSLGAPEVYRTWIKEALKDSLTINSSDAIKVQFLDTSSEPWRFSIKIKTPAHPSFKELIDPSLKEQTDPFPDGVRYWIDTSLNPIEEIFINKADSDMGLCLIIRTLYLYGTLPANFGEGKKLQWRDRKPPAPDFYHFFARKAKPITDNPDLQDRITAVETKLQIMLEESAGSPNSGAIHFSPLAQEILKQAILGYKFWMDESFSSFENAGNPGNEKMLSYFNKARRDIDIARKADHREGIETFSEKEFWSENHYIMFASSEYLAGQLWESETFQPGKEFLVPQVYVAAGPNGEAVPLTYMDKSAPLSGNQRMERGKARTLKWLNNRLMFGWAEFNSSGYYREHLMALLNLVDFSLDEEVKKKAEIATDLLLFDLIRFSHKGSMGAAGGRSQFKSKNTGWDNALGDVVEIILGSRGAFVNREGDIGCSFATTTYKIPDVLLQIGNYPPDSFVDRSRVSVTFDEASKYGIQYSRKSDKKTSIEQGFASKRANYFGFIKDNNDEIARTHFAYGAKEDDTVFWWTLSAYFNKEVVKNTFELIKAFGLRKTGVFDQLFDVIKTIIPLIEKTSHGLIGAAIGSVTGAGIATLAGAAIGFFADDIFDYSVIEEGSNDLSFFLEGSTRTRANILTYRNRDVMLSSLQNFRAGQFNFQSSVNQATLNTTVNVFTTAAFSGLDLSSLETGFLGSVLGGAASGGFAGALLGAFVGVAANEIFIEGRETLATHGDGPGWWTGYWALPMVVQHDGAAILAYDFNSTQKKLAKAGSHVWFPKAGFRQTEERRTSAYEDDNFFLLDIADIGPKGYWLFGQIVHKENKIDPDANEEGYIGVFSNQRPGWLTRDSDFYKDKLDGLKSKLFNPSDPTLKSFKALENEPDFFEEKDWYVSGKNIWIIQVGSKTEFGTYDNFKDRVSKAKVVIDDAGDMECRYSIPGKDGSSQTLSLNYEDGGKFSLDGKQFDTVLYPRFENPFVRGDLVEWGQREYVIEHNGKSLLHDFTNMKVPVRLEGEKPPLDGAATVKGLVIYLQTGNEEMEEFTVATATVNIGCEAVAVDEVIAAGPVDEKTDHDPEWIFFDKPARLTPDMTLEIKHPPSSDGDDDPEWNMSFSLKALMGDRRLYDCSVSFPGGHFVDGRRSTGAMPFSVQVSRWQTWQMLDETSFEFFQVSGRPGWDAYYYDYSDLLAIDSNKRLWHRQLEACPGPNSEWKAVGTTGPSFLFKESPSVCSISTRPGNLFLFAMNDEELFDCYAFDGDDVSDKKWERLKPETVPTTILGLPVTNAAPVPVPLSAQTQIVAKVSEEGQPGVDLYLSGADDSFYSHAAWMPDGSGSWRQIDTNLVFKPLAGAPFEVCGGHLFALDNHRRLWVGALDDTDLKITPAWNQLTDDLTNITNFSVAQKGTVFTILISTIRGEIRAAAFSSTDSPIVWERVGEGSNFFALIRAKLTWAIPREGHLDIFTTGADGKVYTTYWETQVGWETGHDWRIIDPNGHHFLSKGAGLFALSRVNNQLEIFTSDSDNKLWKTWWT
jgi:hypothetical protein